MSIFDKTRYLRTLLILLPIGIALSYWGIEGLTKNVDDLPYIKGIISDFKIDQLYYSTCECQLETFLIFIKNQEKPFITKIAKHVEALKTTAINQGDFAEIWIWDKTNDNRIRQLKLNGELIIPYNKTVNIYLGFLIVGVILIIICIFYIIKSPEDLLGKKEN